MKDLLKLGISGPAGCGKTYSSLMVAQKFGHPCLIDCEDKATFYISRFNFDIVQLQPPFETKKLINAINEIKNEVIIIDSLSQFWAGEGGILDVQANLFLNCGNMQQAWNKVMPDVHSLINIVKKTNKHLIVTFRVKQDYLITKDNNNNERIIKVGLAPVFKDGIEYEFPVFIEMNINNTINTIKDVSGTLQKYTLQLFSEDVAEEIKKIFSVEESEIYTIVQNIINEASLSAGDSNGLKRIYKKHEKFIDKMPPHQKEIIINEFSRLKKISNI